MVERLQASSCEPEVRKISSVVEAMVESDASTGRTPRAVAIRIMQLVMVGSGVYKTVGGITMRAPRNSAQNDALIE
jgi:hypothetical protein